MILKKADRPVLKIENMRGGEGEVLMRHLTTRESLPSKTRILAEIVLQPGCTVGAHSHKGEEEVYYVMKGTATVLDDGVYKTLVAGDVAITNGETPHGLKNLSDDELVILAIVVLDS